MVTRMHSDMNEGIRLSIRLRAIADFVSPGVRVVDVGCDHGYLSIDLIRSGKAIHCIASDVNRGPLLRAKENIALYGLDKQIETRLSNGLERIDPGEVDCVAIAGMGGKLILRILKDGREVLQHLKELILEPQSDLECVRQELKDLGFVIDAENFVLDEGKYYPVLHCVPWQEKEAGLENTATDGPGSTDCPADLFPDRKRLFDKYGPFLLKEKNPVLKEYLIKRKEKYQGILRGLAEAETPSAVIRKAEMEKEMQYLEAALAMYEV